MDRVLADEEVLGEDGIEVDYIDGREDFALPLLGKVGKNGDFVAHLPLDLPVGQP